jgi:hypothetical protein
LRNQIYQGGGAGRFDDRPAWALENGIRTDAVYQILKEVIERGEVISYRALSDAYENKTGQRVHWRNWTPVLDILGNWSRRRGLPTIAAVVVNGQEGMPGDRFFGRSRAPKSGLRQRWLKLLERVYSADWPGAM